MKTVILKVNNATQTITEHEIVVDDGQPTVVDVIPNVNYELVDFVTGNAPASIFTKRQSDDLYITMDNSGRQADLIIVGYYNSVGNEITGLAEDGSYYYYVPVNEQVDSFIAALDENESKTQMLGGDVQSSPWWVGASDISVLTDSVLAANPETVINSLQTTVQTAEAAAAVPAGIPWLLGVTSLGIIISNLSDDDPIKKDSDEVVPPSINTDATDTVITPNDNISLLTIRYTDAANNTLEVDITKDIDTNQWTAATTLPVGMTLNEVTGEVTLRMAQIDEMSPINAIAKNIDDDSVQATLLGAGNDTIAIDELTADSINAGLGVDTLNLTMSDVIASSSETLNVYGFEAINFMGDNNHLNIDSTNFAAGGDNKSFINSASKNNVVDLANNSDANDIDLGNWTQSDSNITAVDTPGNTHAYNVYSDGANMLYIQTDITVI